VALTLAVFGLTRFKTCAGISLPHVEAALQRLVLSPYTIRRYLERWRISTLKCCSIQRGAGHPRRLRLPLRNNGPNIAGKRISIYRWCEASGNAPDLLPQRTESGRRAASRRKILPLRGPQAHRRGRGPRLIWTRLIFESPGGPHPYGGERAHRRESSRPRLSAPAARQTARWSCGKSPPVPLAHHLEFCVPSP